MLGFHWSFRFEFCIGDFPPLVPSFDLRFYIVFSFCFLCVIFENSDSSIIHLIDLFALFSSASYLAKAVVFFCPSDLLYSCLVCLCTRGWVRTIFAMFCSADIVIVSSFLILKFYLTYRLGHFRYFVQFMKSCADFSVVDIYLSSEAVWLINRFGVYGLEPWVIGAFAAWWDCSDDLLIVVGFVFGGKLFGNLFAGFEAVDCGNLSGGDFWLGVLDITQMSSNHFHWSTRTKAA